MNRIERVRSDEKPDLKLTDAKRKRSKPAPKTSETYPLRLTRTQRESLIQFVRLKRPIKIKLEGAGEGTQFVAVTRKELDHLDDEVGQAAVCAPSPHNQRLVAVLNKIADFFDEEQLSDSDEPRPCKQAPDNYADLLYQFKIVLLDVRPHVWRRFQLRDCTLDFLHETIQAVMGWENYHLHQFVIAGDLYGPLPPDEFDFGPKMRDENHVLLSNLLPKTAKRIRWVYEYDFGDGWRHEVLFEGYPPAKKGRKYPLCLDGAQACPPEDCGGPWGYPNFLDAINDPRHEEHEDMREWIGGNFDPNAFDVKKTNREVKKYVRVKS